MAAGKHEIDMLNGPLAGRIFSFAFPMVISGILQLLFNAADVIVVGKFESSDALAAVGSTTSLDMLIINLFIGLSVGSNVVAAHHYGAGRTKDVSETVHTSVLLSIFVGIGLAVVGFFGSETFLTMMSTPSEILGDATLYMRIIFIGMPATMIYNFGYACLRVTGDTKRPLYYLVFSGCVNVGLNLLFVIVFHMGVAGVATATSIAQGISAFLILRCLSKENNALKLSAGKLKIHRAKLAGILKIGLPAGIQGVVFSVSNVVIQSTVNSFGTVVIAGNTAAVNLEGFIYYAMNPFSQAAITFTSQNTGAGKHERINRIFGISLFFAVVIGLVFSVVMLVFGRSFLGIYSDDAGVIEAGMVRFNCVLMSYATLGIMEVFSGSIRGMGHSLTPMLVSMFCVVGIRLIWVWAVFPLTGTIENLYLSYPISWIAADICYLICFIYFRKKLTAGMPVRRL